MDIKVELQEPYHKLEQLVVGLGVGDILVLGKVERCKDWEDKVGDYMEVCCAWMQVVAGDLIDESFVRSQDGYFYRRNLYGEETLHSDYDIIFAGEDDVFLGVAVARNYDSPLDVLYGWVQFHREAEGTVSFVTSVLDLTGKGVVVGATPEPSSALLLLVGGALLALRRRALV